MLCSDSESTSLRRIFVGNLEDLVTARLFGCEAGCTRTLGTSSWVAVRQAVVAGCVFRSVAVGSRLCVYLSETSTCWSVTALLVGRLRGVIISGLELWNIHLHRSSQHADVLDHGVTALLLVDVGRPEHRGLWHFRVSHSVHEISGVLDPTQCCVHRRSEEALWSLFGLLCAWALSFTAVVRNSAPLPWLGGLRPCCPHLVLDACVSPAPARGRG